MDVHVHVHVRVRVHVRCHATEPYILYCKQPFRRTLSHVSRLPDTGQPLKVGESDLSLSEGIIGNCMTMIGQAGQDWTSTVPYSTVANSSISLTW